MHEKGIFLRNEFVWELLRSIDEFKIISLSSEFGFITSSPALHLCVRQGSQDQVDSRWSAAVPGVSNLAWTKPQIYYSILISILFFLERRFKRTEERFPRYWRFQSTNALFLANYFENNSPWILKPPILAVLIDFHLETSYCEKIKSSSIEVDWGQFGKQVYSNQLEPRGWFQLTV